MLAGASCLALKKALQTRGIALDASLDGFVKLQNIEEFAPIVDPEYRKMCLNGSIEAFAWYLLREDSEGGHRTPPAKDFGYRGERIEMGAAVGQICEHIDSLGGVDGIIGFSQGGELAYLVAETTWRLSAESQAKLRFIGTFGSEDTFNQRGVPPFPIPASISFFICYGEDDEDAAHDSATLQSALNEAGVAKVVVHRVAGLDHHMPKDGDAAYTSMLELIDASLGVAERRPWTDIVKTNPNLLKIVARDPSRENEWSRLTPEMIAEYEKLGGEVHKLIMPDKSQPDYEPSRCFYKAPPDWGRGWEANQEWLHENLWSPNGWDYRERDLEGYREYLYKPTEELSVPSDYPPDRIPKLEVPSLDDLNARNKAKFEARPDLREFCEWFYDTED